MALTPEQKSEVDRLVNQRIDEFKAQQSKRNAALKALRSGGRVIEGTEEQLFSLLEKEGLLVEDNGKFLITTKDKYGYPVKEEISKVLPSLLKDKYAHYAADDTGISQNTSAKTPDNLEGLSTQQLYKMAQEGDNSSLDKVFQQVKELYA